MGSVTPCLPQAVWWTERLAGASERRGENAKEGFYPRCQRKPVLHPGRYRRPGDDSVGVCGRGVLLPLLVTGYTFICQNVHGHCQHLYFWTSSSKDGWPILQLVSSAILEGEPAISKPGIF
jgi:hypothetical protein